MSSKGPWVPRVLKKRATEFNVEHPEASSSATPVAGGISATAEFKVVNPTILRIPIVLTPILCWFQGAADLEELNDEQTPTKKAKVEAPSSTAAHEAEQQDGQHKTEPSEVKDEIIEASTPLCPNTSSPLAEDSLTNAPTACRRHLS